jgi:hypothetical protein
MEPIELARNNKFENVNERRGAQTNFQPELSVCKPELYFTAINEDMCDEFEFDEEEDNDNSIDSFDRLAMYNHNYNNNTAVSTTNAGLASSGLLLLHYTNCLNGSSSTKHNCETSIISTAEEHFDIDHHVSLFNEFASLKPKSQSSTTSLLKFFKHKISRPSQVKSSAKKNRLADSISTQLTFNVDVASTPKKIRRSSTPKCVAAAPQTIRKASSSKKVKQFSSTMIKQLSGVVAHQNTVSKPTRFSVATTKTIPPPISSSSYVHIVAVAQVDDKVKLGKRKRSSSKRDVSNKPSAAKKLKYVKESYQCCPAATTTKRRADCSENRKVEAAMQRIPSSLIKNLKYPVKFYPNMRTQDIDRINFVDENVLYTMGSGFRATRQPQQQQHQAKSSCYNIGDYNVWYL